MISDLILVSAILQSRPDCGSQGHPTDRPIHNNHVPASCPVLVDEFLRPRSIVATGQKYQGHVRPRWLHIQHFEEMSNPQTNPRTIPRLLALISRFTVWNCLPLLVTDIQTECSSNGLARCCCFWC